ncbi:hypothetical protein M3Y97_00256900 [Aphelenchoides bicaudatus]|nr:hypothetical protein M3Y97_00256900 [Aphelenchoides bicaudatus]
MDQPNDESHNVSDYFRDHNMAPSNRNQEEYLQAVGSLIAELVDQFVEIHPDHKPRVTEETIQSLANVDVNKLGDSTCSICLEQYVEKDQDGVRELPCKHRYHFDCIKNWLNHATNCPTCRYELPTDDAMFEAFKKRKLEQKRIQADIAELHDSMFS